jgi:anti-sigma B factor antagonist
MSDELIERAGIAIFKPAARLIDQTNADAYLGPVKPAAERGDRIILDLEAVQFLNSSGLGAIVALIQDARAKGGEVSICSPTAPVKALFAMVRLENIAAVYADRSDAEAASNDAKP